MPTFWPNLGQKWVKLQHQFLTGSHLFHSCGQNLEQHSCSSFRNEQSHPSTSTWKKEQNNKCYFSQIYHLPPKSITDSTITLTHVTGTRIRGIIKQLTRSKQLSENGQDVQGGLDILSVLSVTNSTLVKMLHSMQSFLFHNLMQIPLESFTQLWNVSVK